MLKQKNIVLVNKYLAVLVASIATGVVSAGEWRASSGISTGFNYTDNVNLESSNQDSEMIATVTPRISLSGKGGRANVDLNASVEFTTLDNRDDSYNLQLQGNADIELVERLVYVDANATVTQNAINPLQASGSDNLNNSSNRTTTSSLRVSPYVKGQFKSIAEYELRYTRDEVSNSDVANGDSSSDQFGVSVGSGKDFSKLSWQFKGNHKNTDLESGSSNQTSSIDFTLGYQVNRKWKLSGTVGQEWNDIVSNRQDTDGMTWDFGVTWTPSPRTYFDAGFGERFFGNTRRLSFSHKSRRTVWTANYTHTLTDAHSILSDQDVQSLTASAEYFELLNQVFGEQAQAYTGAPLEVIRNLLAINNSSLVDKRFTTAFTMRGQRTDLTISGTHSTQSYEDSSQETELLNVTVSLDRRLSGLLSANANLGWSESESSGGSASSAETIRIGAGLNQALGKRTDLRLTYSYTDRDSDQAGQSYDENRLALTLVHDF